MTAGETNRYELTGLQWDALVSHLQAGTCTPILGAGASYPTLPLAGQLAKLMAEALRYPFMPIVDAEKKGETKAQSGTLDLAEVAQYITVDSGDATYPKNWIRKLFQTIEPPDFNKPGEPHGVLAGFNLPLYITTNYDDFMFQALERQGKKPERAMVLWNSSIDPDWSVFKRNPDYRLSPQTPLVYHLHGHVDMPESMVLTEDDYLDYLVEISEDPALLPTPIVGKMSNTSLLVIGYGLKDWNFRVLLRGIMKSVAKSQTKLKVTVQFPPEEQAEERMAYLTKYYDKSYSLTACFDDASNFVQRLKDLVK